MQTLNVIGAGRLGRTLASLWQQRHVFQIGAIFNRSPDSSADACAFIGAGNAAASIETMPPADLWLIAVADDQIESVATQLATRLAAFQSNGTDNEPGQTSSPLVFHCSGALPASALSACTGANLASAHPVHSFADPQRSLTDLPGATVALEGAPTAVDTLATAFAALDCHCIRLSPEQKVLYHTGSVMACNYLTVLMDLSLRTFAAAGIDDATAKQLLAPIVLQTAQNNFALGPQNALTGPLVRGDIRTVTRQLDALEELAAHLPEDAPHLARVYRTLGEAALPLATNAGLSTALSLQLKTLFSEKPT
ncbi:F420-dependent NADP oxidoreductase [Microbulbifer sp. CAU 1566]|uniref:Rossmann-like and DUF2520 domain-containing protein n=1 Tax=Microbulbifer sp. CAU 1566 TaxID=2933269 RepID=UPI0020048A45|nr:Rossmann-like and DUF2520 domain-containing protein [Microbulbifer sp. CAU 1566]MCK7595711.1 F420-dependent NADP oxidoreductase [Microbulbifer sp. CAU 1566]